MLEATIPWSVFGVYPTSGQIFGFALGISADEVASTAQQQALWSSDPYRLLTNPMTWGTLELSPNTAP